MLKIDNINNVDALEALVVDVTNAVSVKICHPNDCASPETQHHMPTLLLVEDNHIALKIVENMVSQMRCQFISCMDGESALHMIETKQLDLIITDIGLPGISGIELTEKIRIWESKTDRKPIPIIGLSAHVPEQTKKNCLQSGMNQILSKPLGLNDLKAIQHQFCNPVS